MLVISSSFKKYGLFHHREWIQISCGALSCEMQSAGISADCTECPKALSERSWMSATLFETKVDQRDD